MQTSKMDQQETAVEEHLRNPLFLNALQSIEEGGKIINADPNILARLKRPKRCIIVSVPVRMDDYNVKVFNGYRVQYNSTLGPYKGGVRYHQDVNLGEVVGLAALMMIKNSVMGLPYGGGKGGITVDPTKLSRTEKQNLTRRYTSEIGPFIGPSIDIPAPDVGTDPQTMAWMMDTYSQEQGYTQSGVVTGKPVEIGGSLGRNGATGLGVVYVTERAFEKLGKNLKGATIAVQGFGNVGSHAALYAFERGAKVLAVSDVNGGIFNGDGLNIPALIEYVKANKTIAGFEKSQKITNEELLYLEVDALMPCALEGVIGTHNVDKVKARMIVEGANGPVTNDATKILHKRGVFLIPDVIANGGGVVVSYFEWVQDSMSFFWDEDEVNGRLKSIIVKAFDKAHTMAHEKNVDMRQAAMAVSVDRLQKGHAPSRTVSPISMMNLIKYLPAGLAHELAPLGLKIYADIFGEPRTPEWRPFTWKGIHFANRLGIAGGVDKNADNLDSWRNLGCGFAEIGTVTPKPQDPNPGVILARDWDAMNLWNKMGFPSAGAQEVYMNLLHSKKPLPILVNIGKNRQTPNENAVGDYIECLQTLDPYADIFVINVSSPNTQGLRDLQNKKFLLGLVSSLTAQTQKPILLKLSPDLSTAELHESIEAAVNAGVSGFILTNTTTYRPNNCPFPVEGELAGKSLGPVAKAFLGETIRILGSIRREMLIVSVGGVLSAEDVQERLDLGADLVEVYSALIFQGLGFFHRVAESFQKEVS